MKREFDALRRIARLAADYIELDTARLSDGVARATTRLELRDALDELRNEFPYLLTPAPHELHATLTRDLHQRLNG